MIENTKKEIYSYVKSISNRITIDNITLFSTANIANELKLSRNLVSQYLNQLHKEYKLIKINTRPVYFLDFETLTMKYQLVDLKWEYLSIEEIFNVLNNAKEKYADFNKAIGKDNSLSYCIEQAITAVTYPSNGLPILIFGESGSGKTFISSLISEYALNNKIIQKGEDIIYVNCMRYQNNSINFIKLINKIIEQEKKRKLIITFDDIHLLETEAIEKILAILEGKSSAFHTTAISHQYILTCSTRLDENIRQKLTARLPIILNLPSLDERLLNEKKNFIQYFFTEEEKKIKYKISISNHVLNLLINFNFIDNINGLRNAIQLSVANAYVKMNPNSSTEMNVFVHNLPDLLISSRTIDTIKDEETNMIRINKDFNTTQTNETLNFFNTMLETYIAFSENTLSFNGFISQCFRKISDYYEYLMFDNKYSNSRIKAIENVTNTIVNEIENTYHLYFPATFQHALASSIFTRLQMHSKFMSFEEQNAKLIESFYQTVCETLSKEAIIADEITNLTFLKLDFKMSNLEKIIITLSIHVYNHNIHNTETLGIIIAHGYSSASSIADTTNNLLGYHLFESCDMPLTMQMPEVAEKVKKLMNVKRNVRNLVLMVDMGSLEHLGENLDSLYNINIGIVNNISTGLAINIGQKILANVSLEHIMKESCNEHLINYKIIINTKRDKAVLFTSENGNIINEKLVDLFKKSLPRKTGIHIIPYDYKTLLDEGDKSFIFNSHEILFICGTLNPNVTSVPFIGLDSFLNTSELSKIASILYSYMNKTELIQFQENLLLNFSMQNVVGYLTILDAQNVIKTVNTALAVLQKKLHINMDFSTSIGLIIHISCMIERLVTHTAVEAEIDFKDINDNQKHYLSIILESLKSISYTYGVKIPMNEALYIYDYINEFLNDSDIAV